MIKEPSVRYSPHGRGYVKIYRKLMTSSVWLSSKTLKVWLWCLLKANFEPIPWEFKGEEIKIQRGEFITGRKHASKDLQMSESSVYRQLKKLANFHCITLKPNNQWTGIVIENYDSYQNVTEESNNQRTTSEQPVNTNKEVYKKDKKDKKDKNIEQTNAFEKLWDIYPRKLGKKGAYIHFKASVKTDQDLSDIHTALHNYCKSTNGKEQEFIQHGKTWFNDWKDWVNYEPPQSKEPTPLPQRRQLE